MSTAFDCIHTPIVGQYSSPHWLSSRECLDECLCLYEHIQQRHCDTQALYAQYRLWAMLYWQPIYLAVSAVHLNHGIVDTALIKQIRRSDRICGYIQSSLHFTASRKNVEALIARQAIILKSTLEKYLARISEYATYKSRQAWGLVADCIAMSLLNLKETHPGFSEQDIAVWLRQWLTHMGLTDSKGQWLTNLSHCTTSGLQLSRRTCCLYYLVDANDLCVSCPKHKRHTDSYNLILKTAC